MIVNKLIRKAHYYCEDRYVIKDNLYMVIDGATPLQQSIKKYPGSSAAFFVSNVKKEVMKDDNVLQTLENVSKNMYKEFEDESLIPSAGMSFVQLIDDKVICYNIGDCEIFIRFNDGSYKRIVDDRLIKLDNIALEEYSKIRKDCKNHKEAIQKIQSLLIHNRSLMNKQNGYDIYAPNKNGKVKFSKQELNLKNISEIYIYTDGLSEAFETLNIYKDANEMLRQNCDINYIVDNIIRVSNSDKECKLYPRFKRIDDITVIQILMNK